MFSATLIFKQLEHANKFAESALPQEHRLSLILLDNLIEVVLKSHAETSFGFDFPSWMDGFKQKYPKKMRKSVISYFDELLAFSHKEKMITEPEQKILKFAHRIRNQTYHDNTHNENLTIASILMLMSLLRKNLPRWKTGASLYEISLTKNLYFDDPFEIGKDAAWKKITHKLSGFADAAEQTPSKLLMDDLSEKVDEIEKSLQFLDKDLKDFDLNEMNDFNRFPFNHVMLPSFEAKALAAKKAFFIQFCHFTVENENNYKDSTDKSEIEALLKQLAKYMKNRDQQLRVNLKAIKERILKMRSLSDAEAVEAYYYCYSKIRPLHAASQEASRTLDGYIQHCINVARGK